MLHPRSEKSFQFDLPYKYLAIKSDVWFITITDNDDVLGYMVSAGHFCRLNATPHLVDHTHDCRFYLFRNDKVAIRKFYKIYLVSQTTDKTVSIDQTL